MIAPSADGCNAGDRVNAKPAKPAKLLAWNDEVTRNPPSSRNATRQRATARDAGLPDGKRLTNTSPSRLVVCVCETLFVWQAAGNAGRCRTLAGRSHEAA